MNQALTLSNEWDKVFPKSQKVNHSKYRYYSVRKTGKFLREVSGLNI